jgi:2'-hydroxyisoflavone reductase
MNRRRFLQASLLAAAAPAALPRLVRPLLASAPKKVLVLGGTSFLGPAVVEAAVVAGHTVTLFNRGVTNPGLFPNLEKLRGFRSAEAADENFSALGERRWDAVIDVWPSDPPRVACGTGRSITCTCPRSPPTTRRTFRGRA